MYQRILSDAVKELKKENFKELFEEERRETGNYVEETVLETDLALLIPDSYVSDIPERIALYRKLDGRILKMISKFLRMLEDRFGPVLQETEELLQTIRLRWLSRILEWKR